MKKSILCLIILFCFVDFTYAADECNGDLDGDGAVDGKFKYKEATS